MDQSQRKRKISAPDLSQNLFHHNQDLHFLNNLPNGINVGAKDEELVEISRNVRSRIEIPNSPIRRAKEDTVWMERSHSEGTKRKVKRLELSQGGGIARVLDTELDSTNREQFTPSRLSGLGGGLGLLLPLPLPLTSPSTFQFYDKSPSLSPASSHFGLLFPPSHDSALSCTSELHLPVDLGSSFARGTTSGNRSGSPPPPFGSFPSPQLTPLVFSPSNSSASTFSSNLTQVEPQGGPNRNRKHLMPVSLKRSRSFSAPTGNNRTDIENRPPLIDQKGIPVFSRSIYDFPQRKKNLDGISSDGIKYRFRKISTERFQSVVKGFALAVPILVPPPRTSITLSQEELLCLHHSAQRISSSISTTGRTIALPLISTSLLPPITRESLTELDLIKVFKNEQLRHDIVFDSGLMFRPNYDGEKGERKKLLANRYWQAVAREIDSSCRCTTFNSTEVLLKCVCGEVKNRERTLPSRLGYLISELRDIILTLLPNEDKRDIRANVISILDPKRFIETSSDGLKFNLSLARFIGNILKLHCAPMRDDGIEEMILCFSSVKTDKVGITAAKGLRKAFEMVELMKLDIANHQLRTLRPYLLESSIEFERQIFHDSLEAKTSYQKTSKWIKRVTAKLPRSTMVSIIGSGILEIILHSPGDSSTELPETLLLDSSRLIALHSDVTNLTIVYLLLLLFRQLSTTARLTHLEIESMRKEIWCLLPKEKASFGIGLKKIGNSLWREDMRGVLIQITVRAQCIISSRGNTTDYVYTPDPARLALVQAFFDTNFQLDSSLFKLVQSRLLETIHCVSMETLTRNRKEGMQFGEDSVEPLKSFICQKSMMAENSSSNRSLDKNENDSSTIEAMLIKNGLVGESGVQLVGEKVARIISFHTAIYGKWYASQI